jgi:transposase InsO family protein
LVPELMRRFGRSQRNALRIVKMSASTCFYVSRRKDESVLKSRIKELTDTRVHYGYRRVHVMLRREGHMDNVKRVYRLYREEGLSLRPKRPRCNKAAQLRQPKQPAHVLGVAARCRRSCRAGHPAGAQPVATPAPGCSNGCDPVGRPSRCGGCCQPRCCASPVSF